jgi:hypothetical protein
MSLEKKTYKITGMVPLIVHNVALSDPMNPLAKEIKKISAKRRKTDDDHEAIAKLEFQGGLYLDENENIIMPPECLEALLVSGSKKARLGAKFKSAVMVDDNVKFSFDGPKNWEKRFKDKNCVNRAAVRVKKARVMRTRPQFKDWTIEFTVLYNPEVVDLADIDNALDVAGSQVGLCDWRPRFGRFSVNNGSNNQ